MLGNGRLEAQCIDGIKRLCHIRGKMRKKVWVNAGDVVLVGLREFQDAKADVILKYQADEARSLKAYGELPESSECFLNGGWRGRERGRGVVGRGRASLCSLSRCALTCSLVSFPFLQSASTRRTRSRTRRTRTSTSTSKTSPRFEKEKTLLFAFWHVWKGEVCVCCCVAPLFTPVARVRVDVCSVWG